MISTAISQKVVKKHLSRNTWTYCIIKSSNGMHTLDIQKWKQANKCIENKWFRMEIRVISCLPYRACNIDKDTCCMCLISDWKDCYVAPLWESMLTIPKHLLIRKGRGCSMIVVPTSCSRSFFLITVLSINLFSLMKRMDWRWKYKYYPKWNYVETHNSSKWILVMTNVT